jgi:hypothetical protein
METREILLKADKVNVVFERIADGKIRVTTSSWDDAKVLWPNEALEVAMASVRHKMRVGHRVRSDKFVMAHHHNLHHQSLRPRHHTYDSGKKNFAKHAAVHKTVRTKASS